MAVSVLSQSLAVPPIENLPLLGRTLVVVAHPDDELACAVLLQRLSDPLVVIATDGAPENPYFWSGYGTRDKYAATRRREATESLRGISELAFLNDHSQTHHFSDQALHNNLINAITLLLAVAGGFAPDAILAPAYEGGHPDHDTCSFIAAVLGETLVLPVWEMPLYHRDPRGELVCGEFLQPTADEVQLIATAPELVERKRMVAVYKSQADLEAYLPGSAERYRLQPQYNYSLPPHPGLLNYEVWQWPVTGKEVSLRMRNCRAYLAAGGSK